MSSSKAYLFSSASFYKQPTVAVEGFLTRFRQHHSGPITDAMLREAVECLVEHFIQSLMDDSMESLENRLKRVKGESQ